MQTENVPKCGGKRSWLGSRGTGESPSDIFGGIQVHLVSRVNPLTAKLFNCNFHPLKVVYRWRDPQLQVSENYSDLTK